jgi:hypothetical protein
MSLLFASLLLREQEKLEIHEPKTVSLHYLDAAFALTLVFNTAKRSSEITPTCRN